MSWYHDYVDAWNANDEPAVLGYFAADVRYYDHTIGAQYAGHDGIATFLRRAYVLSSDHRVEPLSFQQSGSDFAAEWEFAGTQDGSLQGLPVTHRSFKFRGVTVGSLDEHGRIRFNRDYWNMTEMLRCLGMMPPPLGAPVD